MSRMNDIKQNIFEQLTERGIKFTVTGFGDGTYLFGIPDLSEDFAAPTWQEGIDYFTKTLDYDKGAAGDGEQF